jgi:hypothetical protein
VTSTELSYEGYVKYADGSVISVQCAEGRCLECPDELPDGEMNGSSAEPVLGDGYYCEHGCGHGPAEGRPAPGPAVEFPPEMIDTLITAAGKLRRSAGGRDADDMLTARQREALDLAAAAHLARLAGQGDAGRALPGEGGRP